MLNLVSWKRSHPVWFYEQILQKNLAELSVIAQRVVFKGTGPLGEDSIQDVDLMIRWCFIKKSRGLYEFAMEKRRESQTKSKKERAARKRLNADTKPLELEKKNKTDSAADAVA